MTQFVPTEKKDEAGSPEPMSAGSSSTATSIVALPREDGGCPPAVPQEEEPTVVSFEPDDPQNPHNWSTVLLPPYQPTPTRMYPLPC